jgi:hypothetical protein
MARVGASRVGDDMKNRTSAHRSARVTAQPERVRPRTADAGAVSPAAAFVLDVQRLSGNQAVLGMLRRAYAGPTSGVMPSVVQRHCFEQFATYAEAKAANPYADEHLDDQADERITNHVGEGFGLAERANIKQTNKDGHAGKLTSDRDGAELHDQDVSKTPHVDHRFPASRGGTNRYANARVMPANENISKGQKLELDREPDAPLAPYRLLLDFGTRGKGWPFSADQKREIYSANRAHYSSDKITSDVDGKTKLERYDSSTVADIDHIQAKSDGGCNYYFNAAVIAKDKNIAKSGTRGAENPNDELDWKLGETTLKKYFMKKESGVDESSQSDESSSDF